MRVRALTTAAIIWAAAALGGACGLGALNDPVLIASALTLLLIVALHPLEKRIEGRARNNKHKPTED